MGRIYTSSARTYDAGADGLGKLDLAQTEDDNATQTFPIVDLFQTDDLDADITYTPRAALLADIHVDFRVSGTTNVITVELGNASDMSDAVAFGSFDLDVGGLGDRVIPLYNHLGNDVLFRYVQLTGAAADSRLRASIRKRY